MKLGLDRRTGLSRILTSSKSKDDLGTGNCSYVLNTNSSSPELYLYKSNILLWRSGHWNGIGWSGLPDLYKPNMLFNSSLVNNQTETTISWTEILQGTFQRSVVNESGYIERLVSRDTREGGKIWLSLGKMPDKLCDNYGKCGTFGKCELHNDTRFECTCLPGFQPKSPSEWSSRNASGGCVRKRGQESICKSGDGFVKVENVKLPDSSPAQLDEKLSLKDCRQKCLQNCSCTAGGQNLYVRVDALELGTQQFTSGHSNGFFANKRRLAIMIVILLVTPLLTILCAYWLIRRKRKARERKFKLFNDVTASSTTFQDSHKLGGGRRKPDLPFFDISTILAATDNFSPTKRLGQGGFGPVYKGQLANGQEIAVKTLSRSSRQGTEEFKNEVMLIAKLQHRNLVRLFGCCIHKEEKMLIYEYMPNKSLDFFIFDEIGRQLLDWSKRFEIVSDFGLARMFGDDQNEANTNRVVGTYGYMAPEYAMEGLYSTKSDVFSFGVLTLEIISGKRNNHYHIASPCLNLIGHAWDLWMEGKALDIVDSSLGQAYPAHGVSRCIQIGLLCVQEQATDRPTMVEILFMLGNETTLPAPNKPAFINRKNINNGQDSSNSAEAPGSINDVTISVLEAR
ncbi:hypothetical protein CMV_004150 [Castanea mollissima]|uniref:non-specific serine/threonine protein kinase n=1 Tax=Castanea mollissima TaxID=60419 RepID=A0A8J4W548_9ROSI|nr:hypothetical protein CMV_004150 [Castanea mollissima]